MLDKFGDSALTSAINALKMFVKECKAKMLFFINMPIIRHIASLYPEAREEIYRDLGREIRVLFSDISDTSDEAVIAQIKKIDQRILENLHQKCDTNKNLKDFSKEILANIYDAFRRSRGK